MGIWNRNEPSWSSSSDMSVAEMRRALHQFGLEPGDGLKDVLGWTEEDDLRGLRTILDSFQDQLENIQEGEGSLREEIEIQMRICATREIYVDKGGDPEDFLSDEYDFSEYLE